MEILYSCPDYFVHIIERLLEKSWLVHNFPDIEDGKEYDFSSYLYNNDVNGVVYTVCLDVNLYQFILNSVKKRTSKQAFRDSIGLVCFCQLAKIELDPSIAVYEKLDYGSGQEKLTEITNDLELFHKINNISDDQLVRYFFGEIEQITPINEYKIGHKEIQENITKYRRLIDWDSLYLIILFITYTSLEKNKTRAEKLKHVIEWMIKYFRMSLVGITYAVVFFSKRPIRKMMKYKHSEEPLKRKKALYNMTWDLYAMNKYFQDWTKREDDKECLYASDDKAFNYLLKISVAIQNSHTIEPLREYLEGDDLDYIDKITKNPNQYFDRVYDGEHWTPNYRKKLIDDLSKKIGIEYA